MEVTKVVGTCGAATIRAWNAMKRSAGNTKQDGVISDQEAQIEDLTAEIGQLMVRELDEGKKAGSGIMERYTAILEMREKMLEAQNRKTYTQTTCPNCNKKTRAGMKYCGNCGEKL